MAARPRSNSVQYGNSKTTTLLHSAKRTRPLFQGRTGCGGRPSGWNDIVTCQRLVCISCLSVLHSWAINDWLVDWLRYYFIDILFLCILGLYAWNKVATQRRFLGNFAVFLSENLSPGPMTDSLVLLLLVLLLCVFLCSVLSYLCVASLFRAINSLPRKTRYVSRHFCRSSLKANKVSKSGGGDKKSRPRISFLPFTVRRLCIALTMPWQCLFDCPSVCPSHAGILSKRLYIYSKCFHHRVATPDHFSFPY